MGFLSEALATLKSRLAYVAPLVEVAGSSSSQAVNLQGNNAGVPKIDGVLRDFGAYTPDPNDVPNGPCDCVWVDTDDATITGISADGTTSQTTQALPNKQWVAMSFKRITAVSAGNVYIGWYKKPSA